MPIDEEHIHPVDLSEPIDLATTYEGKYPKSLFNKGVRTQDKEHVKHIMKEAKDDKIVVWGHYDWRFDIIPKSKIIAVGRKVIVGMGYKGVFQYKVDMNGPLPTEEPVEALGTEA